MTKSGHNIVPQRTSCTAFFEPGSPISIASERKYRENSVREKEIVSPHPQMSLYLQETTFGG